MKFSRMGEAKTVPASVSPCHIKSTPAVHIYECTFNVTAIFVAVGLALYFPNCCFKWCIFGEHGVLKPGPGWCLCGLGETLDPAETVL